MQLADYHFQPLLLTCSVHSSKTKTQTKQIEPRYANLPLLNVASGPSKYQSSMLR